MFLRACFAIVLFAAMMSGNWAQAAAPGLCDAFTGLERLPVELAEVRAGRQNPATVRDQIIQVERIVQTKRFANRFLITDLKRIFAFIGASKADLAAPGNAASRPVPNLTPAINAQLKVLNERYDCREEGRAPADFGQNHSGAVKPTSWSFSGFMGQSAGSGVLILLVVLMIVAIVLPVVLWLSAASRRAKHQQGCNTRALLTAGDTCTVTYVSHIGRRGAKLQAPMEDIPKKDLDLYVAGHRIAAKKDWANEYFMGLTFIETITDQTVSDIIEASRCEDQLSQLGENATECFYPGCHLTCPKHRATQISVKNAV